MYHVPNVVQPKVPPLVAGGSYPLVLGRKGLENYVLVSLVVYSLSHLLEGVSAFVQNEEVVRFLAGLYLRVDEFLVARPAGLLSVSVVLLRQSLARQLSMPRSSGRFHSKFLTVLLAEPDVVRTRTLQRSWFACSHLCSATDLPS